MDLCREILKRVESFERANEPFALQVEGRSIEEVSYHVKLLGQAGLLQVYNPYDHGLHGSMPVALTWAGCEFMDATRDEARWKDVKSKAQKATGTIGFEVLKSVVSANDRGSGEADHEEALTGSVNDG